MKTIVPLVYSKSGEYLKGALCFTQVDHLSGAFCVNGEVLVVPDSLQNTQFTVAAQGYSGYSQSINLGIDGSKQIRVGLQADPNRPQDIILPGLDKCGVIQPVPPTNSIDKLSVTGRGFRVLESGRPWQQLNITAFRLFKNYIDGVDIEPFLDWASSHGNTVRVFFTCKNEFDLHPNMYTWNEVVNFCNKLREFNLYLEAVAFADYGLVFNNTISALNYYNGLVNTLEQMDNVFLELVNEHDVAQNEVPRVFEKPVNIISSHGSSGADADPVTPPWDYMGFHPGRNSEWPRKTKSAMEFEDKYNVPCINGEDQRPDLAGYVIADFKDCGSVSGLLSAGTNAHSLALKRAEIPEGLERSCVEAILSSANLVPSYVQVSGFYVRGQADGGGLCPMIHRDDIALRTFARIIDNEAWAVIVRPTMANPKKAIDGWRIVANWDNLFRLERV